MARGSVSVQFIDMMNETLAEDVDAVLTLASCGPTHDWAMPLKEVGVLHMAITDAGCKRIPADTAITAPLTQGSRDLVQLFRDLRTRNTITWNDITLIHDDSVDQMEMQSIVNLLAEGTMKTPETAITVIDLSMETNTVKRRELMASLGPKPGQPRTKQFIVITYKDEITTLQDMVS
ncbi:hypothetical protein Pcinc_025236 [Petrolisthes cinctipes]|uniref:Uncharacterized protein n=1 Tax=Petrolisthes cinctipes TaxID=88211 RepID=A0AAE1KC97_PETCI|nr:hypothetical protein Pcinc_025236 [Petrolisthes cinctipes]